MSKSNYDHLVFPSGRNVKRIKQDAKAWAKAEKVPLHEALDRMASDNGIDASWQEALSRLQQATRSGHPASPTDIPEVSSPLALELGLTDEELMQLSWDVGTRESNDGLIYSYIIQFDDDNPRDLLDKIDGLSDHNSVEVSANAFDEPEPPAEFMALPQEDFIDTGNDIKILTGILQKGEPQPDGSNTIKTGDLVKLANKSPTGVHQQLTRLKHVRLKLDEMKRYHFTTQDLVRYVQSETRKLDVSGGGFFDVAESEDCPGFFNILLETPDNQTIRFMPNALETVARDAAVELNAPH